MKDRVAEERWYSRPLDWELRPNRRAFLELVGAGILITVMEPDLLGQRSAGPQKVTARLHLNEDGTITALSGKVEEGQGPRTELCQAAAEELRVPIERVRMVMADTDLVPDDGITAGSRTTPVNVPNMRQAAATARELLTGLAAKQWGVEPAILQVQDGVITDKSNGRSMTYADLAKSKDLVAAFAGEIQSGVALTPAQEWKVLGKPVPKLDGRDLVTGRHKFPSDIVRPNVLYGKVLRPPAYGATLQSIDLSEAQALKGVQAFHDGNFVGFVAPSSRLATQAMDLAAKTASWKTTPNAATHKNIHSYLKEHASAFEGGGTAVGTERERRPEAVKALSATYTLAYIQHAPMEPRAAVAEWSDGKLTVWAGCDGPYRARRDLAREFGIPPERVRVIIPDMGGGFGGKHSAEAALEAARLAKAVGRPVWIRWTRPEEFTWAYCRPAAAIDCKAELDSAGKLVSWGFTNFNGGGAALATPYNIPDIHTATVDSDSPLPQGSYRCLAATGNNFARESFMDELATAAGSDPLAFRLAHLENPRLRAVLEEATKRFDWAGRKKRVTETLGVGLACGTEKNSVVAACVEVSVDRAEGAIRVNEVCQAFEAGPILNPANLLSQVQGCIIMGLGGALFEEIQFENGKILNGSFSAYRVPRFKDVPKIDVHLVNNADIAPAGGAETPIIAVAPAIANAVFAATSVRIRSMPIRGEMLRKT